MTLALVIMSQSRPWSDRYLFLAFNAGATTDVEHVELFVCSYLPNSLEGRSTRSVGKAGFREGKNVFKNNDLVR